MNRIICNTCLTILVVVVLVATCFQIGIARLEPVKTRLQVGSATFWSYSATQLFGIAPGQTARFCVGTVDSRGPDLDWTGRISDERGNLLFQLPTKHSAAGTWNCTDVPRSSLPISGDPLTGRAQVAAQLRIQVPSGTKSSDFSALFELINADGTTAAGGAIAGIVIAATTDNNR